MIEINLLPGQKRQTSGSSRDRVMASMRELGSRVKDPMMLVAAAVVVLVLLGVAWGYMNTAREGSQLSSELDQVRVEHRRFRTLLADKRRTEGIRDSLVAQIDVIRTVDGDRYVWPHILDEVTRALPAYTWLTEMNVLGAAPVQQDTVDTGPQPTQFQIVGRTVDIQAYTRFLRQLEASPWIRDVLPIQAQTVIEQERAVTAFTIRGTFTAADSAYMRTVPLSRSVR